MYRIFFLASILLPQAAFTEDALKVSFLKVGLGDSILITCPGGKERALIDAGDSSKNYPEAEELFFRALKERIPDKGKIKTVINTHPHPDHTFNFLSLIESGKYQVERYIDNGANFVSSDIEEKIRKAAKAKGINYLDAFKEKPKTIEICPDLLFELVWLSDESLEELGCPQNLNDCSLVTRITYKGVSVLLLADVSEGWERKALREGKLKKENIVKVGHHGSLVSVYKGAWEVMKPEMAVITSGEPGKGRSDFLGYPAEETLLKLKALLPIGGRHSVSILGCKKSGLKCEWNAIDAPIYSTQKSSVDISIEKGSYRIEIIGSKE